MEQSHAAHAKECVKDSEGGSDKERVTKRGKDTLSA